MKATQLLFFGAVQFVRRAVQIVYADASAIMRGGAQLTFCRGGCRLVWPRFQISAGN